MVYAHKFSSDEENELIITKVISNINVFQNVQYASKVLITALTQMLLLYEVPFIGRRFIPILDLTVSLLEFLSKPKSTYFATEEESDDEVEYCNSLILLKNEMKEMDEFTFFKGKIEQLKQMNRDLLVNSISQFPESKKKFFMSILTVERVGNVPRVIHRISRK